MNKNMKKTLLQVFVAVVIFVGLYFGVKIISQPKVVVGEKTIEIVIVDKQAETVFKESFDTDAQLLGELLDEVNEKKGDLFVFDGSKEDEFGRLITEITIVNTESGDFWLYESDNNAVCKEEGFCPGIDLLAIEDGNNFSFNVLEP